MKRKFISRLFKSEHDIESFFNHFLENEQHCKVLEWGIKPMMGANSYYFLCWVVMED